MFGKSKKGLIWEKWKSLKYRFNNSLFVCIVSGFCAMISFTVVLVVSSAIGERRGIQ